MARSNPMPPAPTHNIFRVKLGGLIEGQMTVNVFYYADDKAVGTATSTDLQTVFAALQSPSGLTVPYQAAVSADWSWGPIVIDCPTSPTLAPLITGLLGSGLGGTGHEPNQVAATIVKQTALKGQHGRSRISVPAVPTSWVTGTTITSLGAYGTLASKMKTPMSSGGETFTPGILSMGPKPSRTLGWAEMTTCIVRTVLGTCRRRKPGVGK